MGLNRKVDISMHFPFKNRMEHTIINMIIGEVGIALLKRKKFLTMTKRRERICRLARRG